MIPTKAVKMTSRAFPSRDARRGIRMLPSTLTETLPVARHLLHAIERFSPARCQSTASLEYSRSMGSSSRHSSARTSAVRGLSSLHLQPNISSVAPTSRPSLQNRSSDRPHSPSFFRTANPTGRWIGGVGMTPE